jgi:hypothetical protein
LEACYQRLCGLTAFIVEVNEQAVDNHQQAVTLTTKQVNVIGQQLAQALVELETEGAGSTSPRT